mmetsp:Transcript_68756/g.128274  ORF Transcript_68756/g.128274 Transcript_68756/m.128274 type:complete len:206 (-) Transcript_68756:417-1034(-)
MSRLNQLEQAMLSESSTVTFGREPTRVTGCPPTGLADIKSRWAEFNLSLWVASLSWIANAHTTEDKQVFWQHFLAQGVSVHLLILREIKLWTNPQALIMSSQAYCCHQRSHIKEDTINRWLLQETRTNWGAKDNVQRCSPELKVGPVLGTEALLVTILDAQVCRIVLLLVSLRSLLQPLCHLRWCSCIPHLALRPCIKVLEQLLR